MPQTITKPAAELQVGEIFTSPASLINPRGSEPHLCTDAPERLGTVGPDAKLIRTFGVPYDRAGHLPDGTLEFGRTLHATFNIPADTFVTVHGTAVQSGLQVPGEPPTSIRDETGRRRQSWTREVRRISHSKQYTPDSLFNRFGFQRALCKATKYGALPADLATVSDLPEARITEFLATAPPRLFDC
ncbi:hypothetical protein ACIOJE_35080 [Kitasatospora sp. NPDC087861]|uniref:hypothetical protein n=1 Tax=Kitasatospora sp. NPDC087861 TaxID=3364070 RepID=UPI003822AF07